MVPTSDILYPVAFAGDDLVLQFLADAGEVGIVAGDAHQQVAVILRVLLGIAQDIGVDHVDLQGSTAVFDVTTQEALEFLLVLGIAHQGGAEGHGMAIAIG